MQGEGYLAIGKVELSERKNNSCVIGRQLIGHLSHGGTVATHKLDTDKCVQSHENNWDITQRKGSKAMSYVHC